MEDISAHVLLCGDPMGPRADSPLLPFSFLVCVVFGLGACSAELQGKTVDESLSGATGIGGLDRAVDQ
jgi:hypothetical protein